MHCVDTLANLCLYPLVALTEQMTWKQLEQARAVRTAGAEASDRGSGVLGCGRHQPGRGDHPSGSVQVNDAHAAVLAHDGAIMPMKG